MVCHFKSNVILMLNLLISVIMAQERLVTNETILENLLYQQLQTVLDSLPGISRGIAVSADSTNQLSNWIKQKSIQWLLKQGVSVVETGMKEADSYFQLHFQNPVVQINYYEEGHDLLLRVKKYRRRVEFFLPFIVKDAANRLRFTYSDVLQYEDELGRSQKDRVENQLFSFTRGKTVTSKWIKFFLEPMVVTLSTVAVVYLFYVLRSGS